jgi:hypothetical protein
MRLLIILFLCLVNESALYALNQITESVWIDCNIRVKDQDSHDWLEDIPVLIVCDGKKLQTLMTARNGKVWVNLETGKEYDIHINSGAAKKAYISKMVRFDLRQIDLAGWKYRKSKIMKYQYELEILLFQAEPCENFEFLKDEPLIHYKYVAEKRDLIDIADQGLNRKIRQARRKKCRSERAIF